MTDTMTTDRAAILLELAAQLEAGERPLNAWRTIATALGWEDRTSVMRGLWWDTEKVCRFEAPELAYSLDDVAALTEAVLPGALLTIVVRSTGHAVVRLMRGTVDETGIAPAEPAARLSAALRALASEAGRG